MSSGKSSRQRQLKQERRRRRTATASSRTDGQAGGRPDGQAGSQTGSPAGGPTDGPAGRPAGDQADGSRRLGPLPGERLAGELVAAAVCAAFHRDDETLRRRVAHLADSRAAPGWQRVVDRAVVADLLPGVTQAWARGWQPAELARHVGREYGARATRMMTDVMVAELRSYAAASVDGQWDAQLAALGAEAWWGNDDGSYLSRWLDRERVDRPAAIECAVRVAALLAALPDLPKLCRLPGAARRGSLASDRAAAQAVDERMLGRVRALLAKAESTEFAQEAEALTARAQQLMARHSIDYALLAAGSDRQEVPSARRLGVDNPYEAAKAYLLDVVAQANRCRSVWSSKLGLSTVFGFAGDLAATELLFTSLLVQATTAMVQAGSQRDAYGRSRTRSFRLSFLTAYAHRIGERLTEAAGAAERQAASELPGTDLLPVLAARTVAVDHAVDEMFPALTRRPLRSVRDRQGWLSGRAAADCASLRARSEVTDHCA